ncbi:LacI family DNA-binding transcriptional regulator [Flagellimonas sp. 2504JD4-2]
MGKKKVTIKDIANELGITPSAVSKALNNHPRMSVETKTSVLEVAKKLNYQPNLLASALRKGKSNLVGIIVPRAHSNFFSSVVENIEETLSDHGYNVIITQSNESYQKECKNIDALLHIQVDGIIASLANETADLRYFDKIVSNGIPLVMFDRSEDVLKADYIGINDYGGSKLVVDHLVEQGCKRIAHIAGFANTRIYKNRIEGYRDALAEHGLPLDADLLVESKLTINDGRCIMENFLNMAERPDAVYAAGDYAALGAMKTLIEQGIKIPDEMALVGFSNEPFTSLVAPSITTIDQHSAQIGKLAATAFLKQVAGEPTDLEKIILEPELLIRASSMKIKASSVS